MTKRQKKNKELEKLQSEARCKFWNAFPRRCNDPEGVNMIPWGAEGWKDAVYEEVLIPYHDVFQVLNKKP